MNSNIPNNEPETFVNNSLNTNVDSEPIINAINNAKEEIIDRLTKEIEKMNISKEENVSQEEIKEEPITEETQLTDNTEKEELAEDNVEETNTFDVPAIPDFNVEEEIPQSEETINSEITDQPNEEQTIDAPTEDVSVPEQAMPSEPQAPIVEQEPIVNNEFSPVSVSTIETQETQFVPIDEIIGNAEVEPATIPMSVEDQQVAPANSVESVNAQETPVVEPVTTPEAAPVVAPVQSAIPAEPSPAIEPVITPDVIAQPVVEETTPVAAPVQNVVPAEPSPAPKVTIVTRLYPISEVKTEGQHRVEKVEAGVNENIAKLGEQKTLVNSIAA